MKSILLVPVLLLSCRLASAEVMRRDVQLIVGANDPSFDYDFSSPIGSFAGSDAFDRALEVRLGGRWSWARPGWQVAPAFGADVVVDDSPYGSAGLSAYGLDLTAGVAWAPADRWQFELEGALGRSIASFSLPETTPGGGLQADGGLQRSRLAIRAMRGIGRQWWLSLDLGWTTWSGDLIADKGRSASISGSGWSTGLGLSWRWSARPESLE